MLQSLTGRLIPTLFFVAALLGVVSPIHAEEPPFARQPGLSPDGKQITFSFQGDIWVQAVEGGNARRLTIHEAYDANPMFSPDGRHIAFDSDRSGSTDVWVVGVDGSAPRRLTFWDGNDTLSGWIDNDNLLFTTLRAGNPFFWTSEFMQVPLKGGTPTQFMDGLGREGSVSPDGRFVVFVDGATRKWRRHYRGPANRELWLYDTKKKTYHQLTDFDGCDDSPRWSGKRQITFRSDRTDVQNLYQLELDNNGKATGEPRAITQEKAEDIRYFDITGDGQMFVFERDARLYRQRAGENNATAIDINIVHDNRFANLERIVKTDGAGDLAISPNGKLLAFAVRGELYLMQNEEKKSRTVRLTQNPAFDRDPVWMDDETLIFTSDRHGQYDLFTLTSADPDQKNLFKTLHHKVTRLTDTTVDERDPLPSPDRKKLIFMRDENNLIVADYADGKLSAEKTLYEGWSGPVELSWSPDSRWLAYVQEDLTFNNDVYLQPVDGSRPATNISLHPRIDRMPVWSPDGTKLAFSSAREGTDYDVWFVWLRKEDWLKTKADWDEAEDEEPKEPKTPKKEDAEGDEKKDEKAEDAVEPIVIEFKNIHERLVQVTSAAGFGMPIGFDADSKWIVFGGNDAKGSTGANKLYKIKWNGEDLEKIADGAGGYRNLHMAPDHKTLFAAVGPGRIQRTSLPDGKTTNLGFRATLTIDHRAEMAQIFDESWRMMNQRFYDPQFHGADWQAAHKKYREWALRASTRRDFRDVFSMMLGELNGSHMGMFGDDRYETEKETCGKLGVTFKNTKKGLEIAHVIEDTPADRPSSKLNVGDRILTVNGESVGPNQNIYELLVGTVGEKTVLTVADNKGKERQVVIRPANSVRGEVYEEWVDERRALVDKYSNGRLGYVHIRSMSLAYFYRFEQALIASGMGKDGMVIDVRSNNGGWTTDYLMMVLSVKQHAYTIPRGAAADLEKEKAHFANTYPYGERMPFSAWTGPAIAMCNQFSYSNAEIFSHAFQGLKRGLLVGQPTFGAVISTGARRMIDGTRVRMPFRGWYSKITDKNMENGPAVPDILVPEAPGEGDSDPQLKRAVEELLKQIDG